jgi:hypothetical protein
MILIFTSKIVYWHFFITFDTKSVAMSDGKKHKKGDPPGAGMSGGTSKMSRAEETVLAKGLEGKQDISTQSKYIKALSAQHAKTGEKKSSYTQRSKKKPKVATLDTSTGKRTSEKRKLTPAQKAKAKRVKKTATAGMSAAEKRKYRQR